MIYTSKTRHWGTPIVDGPSEPSYILQPPKLPQFLLEHLKRDVTDQGLFRDVTAENGVKLQWMVLNYSSFQKR